MTTETQHPELTRADNMLKYFKRLREGTYSVSESQAELIKQFWKNLHDYDNEFEYTFNESFTKIKKIKRFIFTPKTQKNEKRN